MNVAHLMLYGMRFDNDLDVLIKAGQAIKHLSNRNASKVTFQHAAYISLIHANDIT